MVVGPRYEFGLGKVGCHTIGTFLQTLWLCGDFPVLPSPVGASREMFIPTSLHP
jgi:hypothetical protein